MSGRRIERTNYNDGSREFLGPYGWTGTIRNSEWFISSEHAAEAVAECDTDKRFRVSIKPWMSA